MKSVTIAGHRYKLPYIDLIPFSGGDLKDLTDSIRLRGKVIQPIVVWKERHTTGEDTVIDGAHRAEIAAELGLKKIPVIMESFASEKEARERVEELNDARRHSPMADLQERRQDRLGKIVEMREAGESVRTIAEETGVSKTQVQRDLHKVAKSRGGTVQPKSGRIIGRDRGGRTQPSSKPIKSTRRAKLLMVCPQCKGRGKVPCPVKESANGELHRSAKKKAKKRLTAKAGKR